MEPLITVSLSCRELQHSVDARGSSLSYRLVVGTQGTLLSIHFVPDSFLWQSVSQPPSSGSPSPSLLVLYRTSLKPLRPPSTPPPPPPLRRSFSLFSLPSSPRLLSSLISLPLSLSLSARARLSLSHSLLQVTVSSSPLWISSRRATGNDSCQQDVLPWQRGP